MANYTTSSRYRHDKESDRQQDIHETLDSDEDETDDVRATCTTNVQETINYTVVSDDDDEAEEFSTEAVTHAEAQPSNSPRKPRKTQTIRNSRLPQPWKAVPEVDFHQHRLTCKKQVELFPEAGDETMIIFLDIATILKNEATGEVRLRGLRLLRNKTSAFLPRKLNEVYLSMDQDLDDARPLREQAMIEVHLDQVRKIRRINYTHEQYPVGSFREHMVFVDRNQYPQRARLQKVQVQEAEPLTCRYIIIRKFETAEDRLATKPKPKESEIRRLYHGETGLSRGLPKRKRETSKREALPRFEDGFCGLGGSSCGAQQAGAKIVGGWDKNKDACISYELNFPEAAVLEMEAHAMTTMFHAYLPEAHICHLSCPCKSVSPQHTRPGRYDDENIAALMATEEYLKARKAVRYVTQEQTSGIITHYPAFFAAMVNQVMSAGFNVRFKMVNFKSYGLASSRKRVILLGARIGEPLPDFPDATHGNEPGLLPYNTIGKAIANVSPNDPWHIIAPYDVDKRRDPYDANSLAKCIDCKSSIPHPSGFRPLSPRELSLLNGFPPTYKFPLELSKTTVIEQIGNAVPPMVWRLVVGKVIETMQNFDAGLIDEAGNDISGEHARSSRARKRTRRDSSASSRTISPDPTPSAVKDSPLRQRFGNPLHRVNREGPSPRPKQKLPCEVDLTLIDD